MSWRAWLDRKSLSPVCGASTRSRSRRSSLAPSARVLLLFALSACSDRSARKPTLAVLDARVWTGNREAPWAEALLVENDRIFAAQGVTSVHHMGSFDDLEIFRKAHAQGKLSTRIYAAVTRRTIDGLNPEGWVPEERITVPEALSAYTRSAARAAFAEERLGMLKEGFLADFAVLDRDITAAPPKQIRDARVVMTVVGGTVVYEQPQRN